ncbi:tagaturonate reductase [Virgibacillus natechei]|uniref:tagaturonate reductase n=1 Tax=Virgibacillus sp. CBA3643 TaxID=2942278 RepID=UPI0035A3AA2F
MELLDKNVFSSINKTDSLKKYPVKVLQVGDGNFIRSFIDWMFYVVNNKTDFHGKVATVQALPEDRTTPKLNAQDGLFTLLLKGKVNGETIEEKHIVDSIDKGINPYTEWQELLKLVEEEQVEFLFSNTTEAGISYSPEDYSSDQSPISYPGKITALLYHRYLHFNGDIQKGFIIVPCELIENNGDELKRISLQIADDWKLPNGFVQWLEYACVFCNTLVDRIVPGYPRNDVEQIHRDLGYRDDLLTVAEPYHLFIIEGPEYVASKLPFKEAGLNVKFDKIAPYRELKVKFLNGGHTMLAPIGILSGVDIVREGMKDPTIFSFIDNALREEVAVTMRQDIKNESNDYIEQIYDRFANPFLNHKLTDISLNSYSKFKSRVWPSLYAYRKRFGQSPKRLIFSFASLLYFFKGVCTNANYKIIDDEHTIEKFKDFYTKFDGSKVELIDFITKIVQEDFLNSDEDMKEMYEEIADNFLLINQEGMNSAINKLEGRG